MKNKEMEYFMPYSAAIFLYIVNYNQNKTFMDDLDEVDQKVFRPQDYLTVSESNFKVEYMEKFLSKQKHIINLSGIRKNLGERKFLDFKKFLFDEDIIDDDRIDLLKFAKAINKFKVFDYLNAFEDSFIKINKEMVKLYNLSVENVKETNDKIFIYLK